MESKTHGAKDDAGDNGSGDEIASKRKRVRLEESEKTEKEDNIYEDDGYISPTNPPILKAPSKEEWIKHHITHVPFKAWHPICVKNAAMNNPHKLTHHFRGIAMFCMDYMYMTKKPDEEQVMHPRLVTKERISGGIWALATIRKGANNSEIVRRIIETIDSIGSPKIIIKTDQESAIIEVQKEVRKELWNELIAMIKKVKEVKEGSDEDSGYKIPGGEVILENSPVGESQSNGFIENAIREVQNQIRKLKAQLEQDITEKIGSDSPIWP